MRSYKKLIHSKSNQKFLLFLIFIIIGIYFINSSEILVNLTNDEWLNNYTTNTSSKIIILMILTFSITFGFPRQFVAISLGFIFGFYYGILFTLLTLIGSSSLGFYIARYLLHPIIVKKYNKKIIKINKFVQKKAFIKMIILRLLPLGSNAVINLCAGCTSIKYKDFLIGSLIGYIPQTLLFTAIGVGIFISPSLKVILVIITVVIITLLIIYLYKSKALKL